MEDLEQFLKEFIEPTIVDFEKNPASVRQAFLACVTTFHAVDYLAHPRKPSTLRQQWRRQSTAFRVVDGVAHAFKHVVSGNPHKPNLKAQEVVSKPGAFDVAAFDSATFDVGAVMLESDPTVNILDTVREAAGFVRAQLMKGQI